MGGKRHYLDLVVEPAYVGGKLYGVLSSAVEITPLKETIARLQQALDEVQVLRGLLAICASCKKIKDEHETWQVRFASATATSAANL